MEIPNTFYRTSIKALILNKEEKFLLNKEDNGYWDIPGGGMEFGETVNETLKREIFEEMGLIVTEVNDKPEYFLAFKNLEKNFWFTNIIFKTKVNDFKIVPSSECVEIRFFNTEEVLKEKISPGVKEFIKVFKKDEKK